MKIKYQLACTIVAALLAFFLPIGSRAQSSSKIMTYLDLRFNPVASEKAAALVEERWQENGQWKAKVYDIVTRALRSEYGYADSSRNYMHGTYILYSNNRKKIVEQQYNMGVGNGNITSRLPDGTPQIKGTLKNDIYVGHTEVYDLEGKLKVIYDTDEQGNGTGIEYMVHTGFTGEGAVKNGKQNGLWVYKNKVDQRKIEVLYDDNATITSETCFDSTGKQLTGECHSDKRPDFPGGAAGWQQHLEKNLRYPKEARKAKMQGDVYVRFVIQTDGTITKIKVVDSPDPSLSEAAEEAVAKSPRWTPAIECNQLIPFTRYERISFVLK